MPTTFRASAARLPPARSDADGARGDSRDRRDAAVADGRGGARAADAFRGRGGRAATCEDGRVRVSLCGISRRARGVDLGDAHSLRRSRSASQRH
jgi:hypothetical protein|eukprot:15844-Pelagococcus_subviridis.AAC.1